MLRRRTGPLAVYSLPSWRRFAHTETPPACARTRSRCTLTAGEPACTRLRPILGDDLPAFLGPFHHWKLASGFAATPQDLLNAAGVC